MFISENFNLNSIKICYKNVPVACSKVSIPNADSPHIATLTQRIIACTQTITTVNIVHTSEFLRYNITYFGKNFFFFFKLTAEFLNYKWHDRLESQIPFEIISKMKKKTVMVNDRLSYGLRLSNISIFM